MGTSVSGGERSTNVGTSVSGGSRLLSQSGMVMELVSELVVVLQSEDRENEFFPLQLINASSALIPVCLYL